jgi:hypothetical protein
MGFILLLRCTAAGRFAPEAHCASLFVGLSADGRMLSGIRVFLKVISNSGDYYDAAGYLT